MRFKRIAAVMACLAFAFALAGCGGAGSVSSGSSEESFADEQFIVDLSKALEARWAITDAASDDALTQDAEKEMLENGVKAELDILEGYTSQKFEDSNLQEKAIKYVNCLKDQQAALDYMTVDYDKYSKEWGSAYDARTQLINEFVDNYGLTVSEENADTLKELVTNGSLVTDKQKKQKAVDKICKNMKFERADEYQYAAVVKNTTDFNFKTFSVRVNLLDKDDVIVESTYASVNNWEDGQKAKFDFWYNEEFEKISVKADYWEAE